jgi:predicted aspartyl protease
LSPKAPFLSVEYTKDKGREDPIVDVEIIVNGKSYLIHPYADTGCDSALGISMEFAEQIGLEKVSDEVQDLTLADGTKVGGYLYKATVKIRDRTFPNLLIPVIDPSMKPLGKSHDNESLLGRGLMDSYNVQFQGKSSPKKLLFED